MSVQTPPPSDTENRVRPRTEPAPMPGQLAPPARTVARWATTFWAILGAFALVGLVAFATWLIARPSAEPSVPSTHDSGIEMLLREQAVVSAPSAHDSGIELVLQERAVTPTLTTHDSGIEMLLRDASVTSTVSTHDSGIETLLRERQAMPSAYSTHDSGIEMVLRS